MKKLKVFLFSSFLVAILSNLKADVSNYFCDYTNINRCLISKGEELGRLILPPKNEEVD